MSSRTLEEQVKLLNNYEKTSRQYRRRYEKGIIKNLSPQGDRLFATVKRMPSTRVDNQGVTVKVDGTYFGNEHGYSDDNITLSETLIPTDIDLSIISGTLEHFVGKEVMVESIDNFPEKVFIQSPDSSARKISIEELRTARLSSNKSELDDSAKKFLLSIGYSPEEVDATFKETLSSIERAKILDYGAAGWQTYAENKANYQDLEESNKAGIVTELPSESDAVSVGLCFKATKALTAR